MKMPIKHEVYVVNGRRFNNKSRDNIRFSQNNGVSIITEIM